MKADNGRIHSLFPLILTVVVLGMGSRGTGDDSKLTGADLTVLESPAKDMMRTYLTVIVDEQFARRNAALAKLRTAEDWARHAEFVRESMAAWSGKFPEKTPLNARVTGRIEHDDYVVEKVLFESRPRFLVSANLYLPKKGSGRRPAVLNVIGHSPAGKATDKVQKRSISQARMGLVALTIDAIGQGERQIAEYASYGNPPGNAHQILGRQAFLAGTHVFHFMAWDVIRAVDYLVSRPEVDPSRIACTGCSGGGMMTTYILPFEPRITVAIPACNPNTWSHRVHANLATDHEQVFPGAFEVGIDPRGDPLFCHVPKPLLINATSDDNLNPVAGVWELSGWLEKAYATYGQPDHFKTTMVDAPHGYNRQQREIAYAWMLKWLQGDDREFDEGEVPIEAERDTWCTANGNVYSSDESRQPHRLILEYFEQHKASWPVPKNQEELVRHKTRMKQLITKVLGLSDQPSEPQVTLKSARVSSLMRITPIIISPEKGIVLPACWIESKDMSEEGPVILYLHDQGKIRLADEPLVEPLVVSEGYRILAVDLRGTGETAPGLESRFWDFLAGKPSFAQRVEDIRSVLCWLSASHAGSIRIWAQGVSGTCAAIAAAMEDSVVALVLEQPLLSFQSVVTVKVPTYGNEILVPGILESFDLPEVYQAACPLKVTLIDPLRGDQRRASYAETVAAYQSVAESYEALGQLDSWRVLPRIDERQRFDQVQGALTKNATAECR